MSVFNEYARYYDLFYRDKDYYGEAEYVHGLIQSHAPGARSLLNLGCGSGAHDRFLVDLNYTVTGVDLSDTMLTIAQQRAAGNDVFDYHQGDIRSIRLNKSFDAVISLFHVMSYQVTNEDVISSFTTARSHLNTGGLFIFDCWYGPAVLTDLPGMRLKEIENENFRVVRIAQPAMRPNDNVVEVEYRFFIQENTVSNHELRERHVMRYFFPPELKLICRHTHFSLINSFGWLSGNKPDMSTWYACFVCQAV
jgi:SAM-dependent methyltransferase